MNPDAEGLHWENDGSNVLMDYSMRAKKSNQKLAQSTWDLLDQQRVENTLVSGRIIDVSEGGVLVKIGLGTIGMIPRVQLTWNPFATISDLTERYQVGQEIGVHIASLNRDTGKISLRPELREPHPIQLCADELNEGDIVSGIIRSVIKSGFIVEIKPNILGLIYYRDMTWRRMGKGSNDLAWMCGFKIGDTIEAIIQRIEFNKKRVSLSRKQMLPDPWLIHGHTFKEGIETIGVVHEISSTGVLVELTEGVYGFLHRKQIFKDSLPKMLDELFTLNQSIRVTIVSCDFDSKKLELSWSGAEAFAD